MRFRFLFTAAGIVGLGAAVSTHYLRPAHAATASVTDASSAPHIAEAVPPPAHPALVAAAMDVHSAHEGHSHAAPVAADAARPRYVALNAGMAQALTMESIPASRFRDELARLSPEARAKALAILDRNGVNELSLDDLHADSTGSLFFSCSAGTHVHEVAAAAAPETAAATAAEATGASVPISQVPLFSSKPDAFATLYIDFNGMVVTNTQWNNADGGQPSYNCVPYDIDGDPTTFSAQEQENILDIARMVADDYSAFDVNVTTVEPTSTNRYTVRALVTKTKDAAGLALPSTSSGSTAGVAYLDIFGFRQTGFYQPAFIYYQVCRTVRGTADCISHEIGHNMGLDHTAESRIYSTYLPPASIPVMNASLGGDVNAWSYIASDVDGDPQNDMDELALQFGLTDDDFAGTTILEQGDGDEFSVTGFIGADDDDTFQFVVGEDSDVTISARPHESLAIDFAGNLNAGIQLFSGSTKLLTAAPAEKQSARITTRLQKGTYTVRVYGDHPNKTNSDTWKYYPTTGSYKLMIGGVQRASVAEPKPLFGATPQADGWYFASGLGWFLPYESSGTDAFMWVWTPDYGWLSVIYDPYATDAATGAGYFWSKNSGWFYSSGTTWPWVFSYQDNGWLYLWKADDTGWIWGSRMDASTTGWYGMF